MPFSTLPVCLAFFFFSSLYRFLMKFIIYQKKKKKLKDKFYKGAVNGCCTAPVNVIKFKINYSRFFRDVEKTEYVLNVC